MVALRANGHEPQAIMLDSIVVPNFMTSKISYVDLLSECEMIGSETIWPRTRKVKILNEIHMFMLACIADVYS